MGVSFINPFRWNEYLNQYQRIHLMKKLIFLLLAISLGPGCYTQVKSSGDYWGYSGRNPRKHVVLRESDTLYNIPPTSQTKEPIEDLGGNIASGGNDVINDQPTIINNYYEVSTWSRPYWDSWGIYGPPSIGFSITYGDPHYFYSGNYSRWHRWDNEPWYWHQSFYNEYCDPFWYGGGPYYGCLVPPYLNYRLYDRPYYGYNNYDRHYGNRQSKPDPNVRTGRINDGDGRSGNFGRSTTGSVNSSPVNTTTNSPTNTGGRSSTVGNSTGHQIQTTSTNPGPGSNGRSTQGNGAASVGNASNAGSTGSAGRSQDTKTSTSPVSPAPTQGGRSGSSSTGEPSKQRYNSLESQKLGRRHQNTADYIPREHVQRNENLIYNSNTGHTHPNNKTGAIYSSSIRNNSSVSQSPTSTAGNGGGWNKRSGRQTHSN